MGRIIGIRHRIKKTAEGEARPTELAIFLDSDRANLLVYKLEDEFAELDFVHGRFPVSYREADKEEDLSKFFSRHIKTRKAKGPDGQEIIKTLVPDRYDGLAQGDTVVSILGGSGRRMMFAISRKAEQIGSKAFWISSGLLNKLREKDKESDAENVAILFAKQASLFHWITIKDRELIILRERLDARTDAMKARIACEQRLRQRTIGKIFCNEEGLYPEGSLEEVLDGEKANDSVYQSLVAEEKAREKELASCVSKMDVYRKLFAPIEGCGPMIASRIIAPVGDIRRFDGNEARFKAYCGVHLRDGQFARRRNNESANWSNEIRQAMYLLAEQFNKRPGSSWGMKFREYKEKLRLKHPETVDENGKKKYSPMHIHKMAKWRTLTKFAEWLHLEWKSLEKIQ